MAFEPARGRIVGHSLRHSLAAMAACAVLLAGCNLGCMFAPCDAPLHVAVQVRDPSGAAMADVHVGVLGHSGETDSRGCMKIDGVIQPASIFRGPEVILRAERPGYKPLREHRPLDAYRVDITLQPADSSKPSSAVWTPATSGASLACN